jgi:hypothetical protein
MRMRFRCRVGDVVGSDSLAVMRVDDCGNPADVDGLKMPVGREIWDGEGETMRELRRLFFTCLSRYVLPVTCARPD